MEEDPRVCALCQSVAYYTAEDQFNDWLASHKDTCTYAESGLDTRKLLLRPPDHLRRKAVVLLRGHNDISALACALAALRASLKSNDVLGVANMQDMLLLAKICSEMGDVDGSAYWLRAAADAVVERPFPQYRQSSAVFRHLASQCLDMRAYDDAAYVYNSFMDMTSSVAGDDHVDISHCQAQLAICSMKQGDVQSALHSTVRCLELRLQFYGKGHPVLSRTLMMAGVLYDIQGYHAEAVKAYYGAHESIVAGQGSALQVAAVQIKLGLALLNQEATEDAHKFLLAAFEAREDELGPAHPETVTARKALNKARAVLGKLDVSGPDADSGVADSGSTTGGLSALMDGFGGFGNDDPDTLEADATEGTGGRGIQAASPPPPPSDFASGLGSGMALPSHGGGGAGADDDGLDALLSTFADAANRADDAAAGRFGGGGGDGGDDGFDGGDGVGLGDDGGGFGDDDGYGGGGFSGGGGGRAGGGGGRYGDPYGGGGEGYDDPYGGGGGGGYDDPYGGGGGGGYGDPYGGGGYDDGGGLDGSLGPDGARGGPAAGGIGGPAMQPGGYGFAQDPYGPGAVPSGNFSPYGAPPAGFGSPASFGGSPAAFGGEGGGFGPAGFGGDAGGYGSPSGFGGSAGGVAGNFGGDAGGFGGAPSGFGGGPSGFGGGPSGFGGDAGGFGGGPSGFGGGPSGFGGDAGGFGGGPSGFGGGPSGFGGDAGGFGGGGPSGFGGDAGGFGGGGPSGFGGGGPSGFGGDAGGFGGGPSGFGGDAGGFGGGGFGGDAGGFGGGGPSGFGGDAGGFGGGPSGIGGGPSGFGGGPSGFGGDMGGFGGGPSGFGGDGGGFGGGPSGFGGDRGGFEGGFGGDTGGFGGGFDGAWGFPGEDKGGRRRRRYSGSSGEYTIGSESGEYQGRRRRRARDEEELPAAPVTLGAEGANLHGLVLMKPQSTEGVMQKGLIQAVDNPSGRRMKAVEVPPEELFAMFKAKMAAVAMFKMLGSQKRQQRMRLKVFILGYCVRMLKLRRFRRYQVKVFTLGFFLGAIKRKNRDRRRTKMFTLGFFSTIVRLRDASRRRTLAFMAGIWAALARQRVFERRRALVFALGVMPMWKRTEGNPVGYQYGKRKKKTTGKGKKAPKYTGPKMRNIHWTGMSEKEAAGTIWESAPKNENQLLAELFPDLMDMFEQKVVERKKKPAGEAKKPKKETVTFIEDKRAYNMGIAMSKFNKLGFPALVQAVFDMNDELLLGADGIDVVMAYVPQPKEVRDGLRYLDKPDVSFGKGEDFVMSCIRHDKDFDPKPFTSRLRCLKFKCSYVEELESVLETVELIHTACKEVLDSSNLKEFLVDIIRPFGNKLNPNKRPVAGIKVNSLNALANTRANDGKPALYYIMGKLSKRREHLLDLYKEFPSAKPCTRVSFATTNAGLNKLKSSLTVVENGVKAAQTRGDDKFIDVMEPVLATARRDIGVAVTKFAEMQEAVAACIKYLGEDPKAAPEDIFRSFAGFMELLGTTTKKYLEDVEKAERKARLDAAKKAEAERRAAARK